jgi:hypothetical protein
MLTDLFASAKSCCYTRVREFARRLAAFEREEVPAAWLSVEDPSTGSWSWPTPASSYLERVIRNWTMAKLANVGLYLHRPFVGTNADLRVDSTWHRAELLRWSRASSSL